MYEKGSYFQISGGKSIFWKNFMSENMFYYTKRIKLNNKTIETKMFSKLVKFIVWFLYIIKDIYTSTFFWKNASLLQKLKNKIPSCTFTMKAIPLVSDEVKLAVHRNENT